MKTKSDTAQRQAARKFVEYWTFQRGSDSNLEFDPNRNLYQGKKGRGMIP